uniref:ComR tetratricopeptide domain-containing protein n=1 Tax=Candidatus Enterococcus clewellii TaxID=1834193 RepID=A0A242K5G9_9ENTE|nr:hypothetical protein A5888_002495 [Enterococcus sp. 9E7_DIV0242]
MIIELYFHCIHFKDYDEQLFMTLSDKVIEQVDYSVDVELFLLIKVLLVAISVFIEYDNYDRLIGAVKVANLIMQTNQDFQKKPAVDVFEGKYWLFSQGDVNRAEQKYLDGAQSVSYTHLDVYKRQLLRWARFIYTVLNLSLIHI